MTPIFDYVVCSIEDSHDIDSLTIDELQSSLLVHEQRMRGHVIEEQALQVAYDGQSHGRGRGRGGFRGRGRGRQGIDRFIIECYNCHKLGHFQYECPKKSCSNHMTGKMKLFIDFDSSFKESVKLGDNSRITVHGKGNIQMEVHGIVHVIKGVFYVPTLKNNMLSIGQIQEKGLTLLIQ
ncbi:hypothetical protein K2173_019544 [Erythroxylum novogranatense]|uniref:CCHC-type domain-containing protein n=1 Tax=Erythroxylum novogranatense TaxID=1862640 RepID=A0AAV8UBR7_9ROSI|nr:hypothetical protein K2173_019544 [Erythroxylum novogranatense]